MIHGCAVTAKVILYVNSYGPFTQEGLDCRRIKYIFEKYQQMVPIVTKDINSELIEAAHGTRAGQQLTRIELASKLGLVKTGPGGSELCLPQAFLVLEQSSKVLEKKVEISRNYIGDLSTCQYFEDAGLLKEILKGNVCTHYRVFKGRVYYAFHKSKAGEECNSCSAEEPKIKIEANYRDANSKESHDLCVFFENNKLKFKLIDPCQTECTVPSLPRIFIHGI